jgi:hypothetical protein
MIQSLHFLRACKHRGRTTSVHNTNFRLIWVTRLTLVQAGRDACQQRNVGPCTITDIKLILKYERSEVFTVVTMSNAVLWDVTLCGSCYNRRSGGTYRLHHQGAKKQLAQCASFASYC